MKIFVTGATGFIGSHLIEAALSRNIHVTALKRNFKSKPVFTLRQEPKWLHGSINTIKESDIADNNAIIHLSSAGVSPKKCKNEEMVAANILDSVLLMEKAYISGIKRFISIGTAHEYPKNYLNKQTNCASNENLQPQNFYGATKAASFLLLKSLAETYGMEFFYARLFNAYGKGQWHQNFWPSLYRAAANDEDFHMSKGDQLCDFIEVEKAANQLLDVCFQDFGKNRVIVKNMRSMKSQTLLEFAESEWKRLNASGKIIAGAK